MSIRLSNGKEIPIGTVEAVKKQLGLKNQARSRHEIPGKTQKRG